MRNGQEESAIDIQLSNAGQYHSRTRRDIRQPLPHNQTNVILIHSNSKHIPVHEVPGLPAQGVAVVVASRNADARLA